MPSLGTKSAGSWYEGRRAGLGGEFRAAVDETIGLIQTLSPPPTCALTMTLRPSGIDCGALIPGSIDTCAGVALAKSQTQISASS
jgi:hypothetical protein